MNDYRQSEHIDETSAGPTDESDERGGSERSERIGIGGGDENVVKVQLAARWTELYRPDRGDSLEDALKRFKRAYTYIDAVTKLIAPDEA